MIPIYSVAAGESKESTQEVISRLAEFSQPPLVEAAEPRIVRSAEMLGELMCDRGKPIMRVKAEREARAMLWAWDHAGELFWWEGSRR